MCFVTSQLHQVNGSSVVFNSFQSINFVSLTLRHYLTFVSLTLPCLLLCTLPVVGGADFLKTGITTVMSPVIALKFVTKKKRSGVGHVSRARQKIFEKKKLGVGD